MILREAMFDELVKIGEQEAKKPSKVLPILGAIAGTYGGYKLGLPAIRKSNLVDKVRRGVEQKELRKLFRNPSAYNREVRIEQKNHFKRLRRSMEDSDNLYKLPKGESFRKQLKTPYYADPTKRSYFHKDISDRANKNLKTRAYDLSRESDKPAIVALTALTGASAAGGIAGYKGTKAVQNIGKKEKKLTKIGEQEDKGLKNALKHIGVGSLGVGAGMLAGQGAIALGEHLKPGIFLPKKPVPGPHTLKVKALKYGLPIATGTGAMLWSRYRQKMNEKLYGKAPDDS